MDPTLLPLRRGHSGRRTASATTNPRSLSAQQRATGFSIAALDPSKRHASISMTAIPDATEDPFAPSMEQHQQQLIKPRRIGRHSTLVRGGSSGAHQQRSPPPQQQGLQQIQPTQQLQHQLHQQHHAVQRVYQPPSQRGKGRRNTVQAADVASLLLATKSPRVQRVHSSPTKRKDLYAAYGTAT
eukprot:m.100791 g.100791  ORF g.100791 m.100791 type:complete len:184 (+) comp13183_c0_seq3:2800-3351(+)